jgi:NADH-quinone oxidoreductase subunit A
VSHAGTLLARTAAVDMAVFFAVLLTGFAYVWYRGDLDWVRAVSSQVAAGQGSAAGGRNATRNTNG